MENKWWFIFGIWLNGFGLGMLFWYFILKKFGKCNGKSNDRNADAP